MRSASNATYTRYHNIERMASCKPKNQVPDPHRFATRPTSIESYKVHVPPSVPIPCPILLPPSMRPNMSFRSHPLTYSYHTLNPDSKPACSSRLCPRTHPRFGRIASRLPAAFPRRSPPAHPNPPEGQRLVLHAGRDELRDDLPLGLRQAPGEALPQACAPNERVVAAGVRFESEVARRRDRGDTCTGRWARVPRSCRTVPNRLVGLGRGS